MLNIFLIIAGFTFLIKGADYLVDGAASIARRLKISDLVIGLTIVAFGTSTPELMVNLFAAGGGKTDIAIGNILGSNIANIFLVLGLTAFLCPLVVKKGTVWKEIPFSLLAALIMGVLANDFLIDKSGISQLSRIDGLILISFFIIFLYYVFGMAKTEKGKMPETKEGEKKAKIPKVILMLAAGLGGVVLGGHWVVSGAVSLAEFFGVSQAFIGLTIVAVGTSLPELATSITAACKKNADIAVGNAVGSNIFNVFWILGLSAIIRPLPFQPNINVDIGVVIFASLLLFAWMFVGKKHVLQRSQGLIFILFYMFYITYLIYRG